MQYVEFTPDGLFLYRWSGKKQKYIRSRPKKKTICTHLRSTCKIAEETSLKDIFDAVDRYKLLKFFISQYSWCSAINEFHRDAQESWRYEEPEYKDQIEYLEIYWGSEIFDNEFQLYTNFHGVGVKQEKTDEDMIPEDGRIKWSVSCSRMWTIAHLPIKLNTKVEVYKNYRDLVTEGENCFTLLEVLDAIYNDISFYGSPEQSEEFLEEMKAETEKIKNGEIPLIPYEQVRKELGLENKEEEQESKRKILLSPDVARQLGVDPNKIPLDDKEILRPDDEK